MRTRVLAAILALIAVSVAGACGGNGPARAPSPAASVTTPPSPTSATATATFLETSPRPLRAAPAQRIEPNTVVYYETRCRNCGQAFVTHLYRVSTDSAGTSRTDDLLALLTADGAQVLSLAGDWERGDVWAAMCAPGTCDTPEKRAGDGELYHSTDGGITWQRVASIDGRTRLIGAFNGHGFTAIEADGQPPVYYQEPEHVRIEPPYWNYTRFTVVQEFGTFWRATRTDGSLDSWFYSADLKPYLTLDSPQPGSIRWIQSTARGQLLEWQANAAGSPSEERIGYLKLDSTVTEFWSWKAASDPLFAPYDRLDVAGATPDGGRIFGTLMTAGGTATGNRLVFIDAGSGMVRPIEQSSLTVAGGDEAVMLWAIEGKFGRVTPGGACAELRWGPEVTSPVYGCATAGVLVRLLDNAPAVISGVTWVAVKAPDRSNVWIDQRNLR